MLDRLATIACFVVILASILWFGLAHQGPHLPEPPQPYNLIDKPMLKPITGTDLVAYFNQHEATMRKQMPDYDEKVQLYRRGAGQSISAWQRELSTR